MLHKLFFLLVMCSGPFLLAGQEGRLLRVEMDSRAGSEPYSLLSLGAEGLLIIYPSGDKDESGKVQWIIQHYNSGLVAQWRRVEAFPSSYLYIRGIYEEDRACLLFGGKDEEGGSILILNPADGSTIPIAFSIPEKTDITYFGRLGAWFLVGTTDRKYKSTPLLIGRDSKVIRLETGLDEDHWLDDGLWDPFSQHIHLVFKYKESKRNHGILLQSFDISGAMRWEQRFGADNGKWPSGARLAQGDSGRVLLIGSYSLDERVASFANQSPSYETASGFFSVVIQDGKLVRAVRYYPFQEFNNFYSHLSYNEVSRMRGGRDGVQPGGIDFNVLLHGLREHKGEFILLAEAYYEKYHYVSRMAYDMYGRPVPSSYTVFDGYQYTNSFIAGFDSSGSGTWNNNFEIRDKLENERKSFVEILPDGEELILTYMDDARIASQAIRGSTVTAPFSYVPLGYSSSKERITEGVSERIIPWYDNYALCFGYQKLRSVASPSSERKNVFYFSKVAYR